MARQQKPRKDEQEDEFLRHLRAQSERGEGFGSRPIDGALLGMVVWAVTRKGGQVSFGTTQDGSRFVITCWYKGFPTKNYFQSVEEAEQGLAFTLDTWVPREEKFDEWRTYGEGFK